MIPLSLYCILICHEESSSGGVITFPVIAENSKNSPAMKKADNAIIENINQNQYILNISMFHNVPVTGCHGAPAEW
jgi:hypothetical protein